MSTTKQQAAAARAAAGDREELRAALTAERAGYVARGLTDRAKQVDAQIKQLGAAAPKAPATDPTPVAKAPAGKRSIKAQPPAPADAPVAADADEAGDPDETED